MLFPIIFAGLCASILLIVKKQKSIYSYLFLASSLVTMVASVTFIQDLFINEFMNMTDVELQYHIPETFVTIFSIALFIGSIFTMNSTSYKEQAYIMIYAHSAIILAMSTGWVATIVTWEIMAIASTFIIAYGGKKDSVKFAFRYAIMHIFGGTLLTFGIVGLIADTGNYLIYNIFSDGTQIYDIFILLGILINLAPPPVSFWLSDGYPSSSSKGAVFLAAFTTKTAILLLLKVALGLPILIYVGVIMILFSTFASLLFINIRKILAYAIIAQLGFMVVAIGAGGNIAIYAVAAHSFIHIAYKSTLFMCSGILSENNVDQSHITQNIWNSNKVFAVVLIFASLTSFAFPYSAAFISKSLISETYHGLHYNILNYTMMFSAAAVALHSGLRVPYLILRNTSRDGAVIKLHIPWNNALALFLWCLILIFISVTPSFVLGYTYGYGSYNYLDKVFSFGNAVNSMILIIAGSIMFIAIGRFNYSKLHDILINKTLHTSLNTIKSLYEFIEYIISHYIVKALRLSEIVRYTHDKSAEYIHSTGHLKRYNVSSITFLVFIAIFILIILYISNII